MLIKIDEIKIKKRVLLTTQNIFLPPTGLVLLEGKNGSGKSLLLKKIFGLLATDATLIEQNNSLILPHHSILDNIALGAYNKKNIIPFLTNNNLAYLLTRKANALSGGELRIVNLLRGLFGEQKIILIDEPTNDLAENHFFWLKNLLLTLAKTRLIILVTHDNTFKRICNYKYELHNKKLIANNIKPFFNPVTYVKYPVLKMNTFFNNKIIPRNWAFLLLPLLFIITISILSSAIITNNKTIPPKAIVSANQVDLLTLHNAGDINLTLLNYLVPKNVGTFLNSESRFLNIFRYHKLKKEYHQIKDTTIPDVFSSNFTFIPIIFRNNKTQTNIYALRTYIEKMGYDYRFTELENELFTYHNYGLWEAQNYLDFDLTIYRNIITKIKKDNNNELEITRAIIILNEGYSFNAFLQDNYFINLNNNVLIYHNDIQQVIEESKQANTNLNIVLGAMALLLLGGGVLILTNIIFLLLSQKRFLLLYYRGANLQTIINNTLQKNNPRLWLGSTISLCFIINIGLGAGITFNLLNYFCSILFLFHIIFVYRYNEIIINKLVTKITNYKYRFI